MQIRLINSRDIAPCAEIFSRSFSGEPWNEAWDVEKANHRLRHMYDSKGFVGMLAQNEDKVLGFVMGNCEPFYHGRIFYLREMCVEQELQRQGIGKQLLANLEKELINQGCVSVYLLTDRNVHAAEFYRQNAYNLNSDMGFFSKRILS